MQLSDAEALQAILGRLEARGVFCRWVKVDVASHSPQMDPLLAELRGELAGVQPQAPAIPRGPGPEAPGPALEVTKTVLPAAKATDTAVAPSCCPFTVASVTLIQVLPPSGLR